MKSVIYFPWNNFTKTNGLLDYQEYFDFDLGTWQFMDGVSLARFGEDTSILKIHNDKDLTSGPEINGLSDKFDAITDKRSIELLSLVNNFNKKLAIFWSGGIDATVMLSAIIKNWPKQDWEKVVVFLNDYSLLENPTFFHNFIRSKFQCQFFKDYASYPDIKQYIITDGLLADRLWKPMLVTDYALAYGDDSCANYWVDEQNNFINFLVEIRKIRKESANNIVARINTNLSSVNVPLKTVNDVFRWVNYNLMWQQTYLCKYTAMFSDHNLSSLVDYKNFYVPWYSSLDYEKWAWSDDMFYELNRRNYKQEKYFAKKYIFDISKDVFFLKFQTKLASLMHTAYDSNYVIFADGTILKSTEQNYETLFKTYMLGQ